MNGMAIWQSATNPSSFWDDGGALAPGDEGFSSDAAAAHFGADGFNYCGTPGWASPAPANASDA